MSFQADIRARVVELLTGKAGTGSFALPLDHLRMVPDGLALDTIDRGIAERTCEITFRSEPTPMNQGWGHQYKTRVLTVRVCYLRTNGGTTTAERQGPQSGPGITAAIEDRIDADLHAIQSSVGRRDHYAPLTPPTGDAVIDVHPDDADPRVVSTGDRVIVEIPFRVTTRELRPGTQTPSA